MTTDWFKTAFGEEYLKLYAHRDENEAGKLADLIMAQTKLPARSLVLDAPCGAGRHLKAFEERGMRTLGFDLSWPLLRDAIDARSLAGKVLRADLRHLPYKAECCDMLVNLFSSLGYFESDEINLKVLEDLASVVRPGGWIIIDFMHSKYVRTNLVPESRREFPDGTVVKDKRWIDDESRRVNKRTDVIPANGKLEVLMESVRLFTPEELREGLAHAGVEIDNEFGDYDGGAFADESARIILVGRKI